MNIYLASVSQTGIARATRESGLCLTSDQLLEIVDAEQACLSEWGRISFGESAATLVIREIAVSPYITDEHAPAALIELIEAFYELREGLPASVTDIEIVELLKESYDHDAAGDAGLAAELARERLSCMLDYSSYEISDNEGNAYRWDPDEWQDDITADGWFGERWEDAVE